MATLTKTTRGTGAQWLWVLFIVTMSVLLLACDGRRRRRSNQPTDGSTPLDGSILVDGGHALDGSLVSDSGPVDGGTMGDGGPVVDSGRSDAGTGSDAGGLLMCPELPGCSAGGVGETCSTAMQLLGGSRVHFSLSHAQSDHTPFGCAADGSHADIAVHWQPSSSGTYHISAVAEPYDGGSSTHDIFLAVFDTPSCDFESELACDDDAAGGLQPTLSFSATGGTSYYIVVSTFEDAPPAEPIELTILPSP